MSHLPSLNIEELRCYALRRSGADLQYVPVRGFLGSSPEQFCKQYKN